MNEKVEALISIVELSDDKERLYLHTKNEEDCNCLWAQLKGQLNDNTEGRQPIVYVLIPSADPPKSLVMELDFQKDSTQLMLLLKYLEFELKSFAFLSEGTTDSIQKQISSSEKSHTDPFAFK